MPKPKRPRDVNQLAKLIVDHLHRQCAARTTGAPGEPDTRYSPARVVGCETHVISGEPDQKHVSTSYIERQTLTMRMAMQDFRSRIPVSV